MPHMLMAQDMMEVIQNQRGFIKMGWKKLLGARMPIKHYWV